MAQKILIMGESGTGKSASLRNCDPAITAVVNPVGKALPFKNHFEMLNNETDARHIVKYMKEQCAAGKKLIVVDDFQYVLAVPYMNRIKETGWDKYNDFGANYFEIIECCKELPDDVVVVYMTHLETLENGLTTVKLIGKLLREKITIEGLFTVVLRTTVSENKYYFCTQNSGKDTVKSPIGMFDSYAIDNDLNYVFDKIRNYYELGDFKSDSEMTAADQAAATDIEKPKKRSRKKSTDDALDDLAEKNNSEIPWEKYEEAVPVPNNDVFQEDVYFYIPAEDNYIMKRAGEPLIDTEYMEQITKEEFNAAVDRIAKEAEAPKKRRTRRVRNG